MCIQHVLLNAHAVFCLYLFCIYTDIPVHAHQHRRIQIPVIAPIPIPSYTSTSKDTYTDMDMDINIYIYVKFLHTDMCIEIHMYIILRSEGTYMHLFCPPRKPWLSPRQVGRQPKKHDVRYPRKGSTREPPFSCSSELSGHCRSNCRGAFCARPPRARDFLKRARPSRESRHITDKLIPLSRR